MPPASVLTQPIFEARTILGDSTAGTTASFGAGPPPLVIVAENGDKRRRGRDRVMRWTSQVENAGEISRNLHIYSSTLQRGTEWRGLLPRKRRRRRRRIGRPPPFNSIYVWVLVRVWSVAGEGADAQGPTLEGRKGVPCFRDEKFSTGLRNFPRKHWRSCRGT